MKSVKIVDGRISEVDGQGYGKIQTPDGEVVHFTLSQVKTELLPVSWTPS
jgi:hypothetical protein